MQKTHTHLILALTTLWTTRGHPLTRMVAGVHRPLSTTLLYINRDLEIYVYKCVQVDRFSPETLASRVPWEFDRHVGQHPLNLAWIGAYS
jgi:hypothetical protein